MKSDGKPSSRIALPDTFIQKRDEAAERVSQKKSSIALKPLFIPGANDFDRVMPNHLARTNLFAPIARGIKIYYDGTQLTSRKDAIIHCWGQQLDEGMADVWMQVMHQKVALGEPIVIQRAAFLRSIGRQNGKYEYGWLHRCFKALSSTSITITVIKKDEPKVYIEAQNPLPMIKTYEVENGTKNIILTLDPRWALMFQTREYAFIDHKSRLQFGQKKDMAKALQRLISTSNDHIHRYELNWLKDMLQFKSPIRKFKVALKAAFDELERLEIIAGGHINISKRGKEQAVWTRLKVRRG